jgi:3-hydroxyisobutyrate dehydrogenase-like beta-hydroxyacid dehydrogenase
MKLGFIGTGRMGQAMVRRLLEAKHDVGVYNRTPEKAKPLAEAGAKILPSIADAARYGDAVYTMLADDAALEDVMFRQGLLDALPKSSTHICAGTHGIPVIRRIKQAHAGKGQALVAAPMMGRPELVSSGTAGVFASGSPEAMGRCKPLFEALRKPPPP